MFTISFEKEEGHKLKFTITGTPTSWATVPGEF
jgi:hypothetical protein